MIIKVVYESYKQNIKKKKKQRLEEYFGIVRVPLVMKLGNFALKQQAFVL